MLDDATGEQLAHLCGEPWIKRKNGRHIEATFRGCQEIAVFSRPWIDKLFVVDTTTVGCYH
jgi:hypothetical protein